MSIVFCYINLSNLVWTKGFDTIIFRSPAVFEFGKYGSNDNFATWDEVEGVNLSRNSQFSEQDDSMKMKIEWQFCTWDEVEGVNLSRNSQFFNRENGNLQWKTLSSANSLRELGDDARDHMETSSDSAFAFRCVPWDHVMMSSQVDFVAHYCCVPGELWITAFWFDE